MFITNGKSLFGNTGLIVSIIILVVLLFLSYNKCYARMENFACTDLQNCKIPQNVRINISGGKVSLSFSVNNQDNLNMPEKFLIVLSQYDKNMRNTGKNEIFLSNEYELGSFTEITDKTINTNLCKIVNGRPICEYRFQNLDVRDADGNLFYYKIGVASVFADKTNSQFVLPGNIASENKLFTLDTSAENQSKQFKAFQTFQGMQKKEGGFGGPPISANIYDKTMATADGQYEFIKSQMGGYPDNLLMDSLDISQGQLNDLVGRTMAPAIINANISA